MGQCGAELDAVVSRQPAPGEIGVESSEALRFSTAQVKLIRLSFFLFNFRFHFTIEIDFAE